ncbi:MAG: HEPN domain-containing protein [Candidatus Nanohaloarchaea archaeon]
MSQVEKELELSEEALADLESMEEVSLRRRYSTLYYAVYHGARAALLSIKYSPETHAGLDSLIHNIMVKENEILEENEASTFSKIKTRREQADYETGFLGDEEEFKELKNDAKELVEKFERIARKNTG